MCQITYQDEVGHQKTSILAATAATFVNALAHQWAFKDFPQDNAAQRSARDTGHQDAPLSLLARPLADVTCCPNSLLSYKC